MDIAARYRLCNIDFTLIALTWDCDSPRLSQAEANHVFGFSTSAALEQFLKGEDESKSWQRYRDEDWGEAHLSL
jgi:hypothetical protein